MGYSFPLEKGIFSFPICVFLIEYESSSRYVMTKTSNFRNTAFDKT